MNMKKILIVDDSIVYRHALTSALSEERDFMVLGSAKNGQEALDFILKNQVDLITLDMEMPVMDGFQLIEKLASLPSSPRVIAFTSLDASGAGNAMRALRLGADDFVTKQEGDGDIKKSIADIRLALIPKIKSLLKINTPSTSFEPVPATPIATKDAKGINNLRKLKAGYDYIFIGCSTGGPEALRNIFTNLKGVKMPPIFVVQHMPPIYTAHMAKTLCESTTYKVVEAKDGDIVKSGYCYIAPGDYHMSIIKIEGNKLKIHLSQEEKECFVRPSVNYLFRSAKELVNKSLFIVLTGMGNDGLAGVQYLVDAGQMTDVLIQDEKSSVVWGMPGEIFQRDLHSEIKGLSEIRESLLNII